MISILFFIFIIWLMIEFIKFAIKATWGLLKVIGIIISIIAFPLAFIVVLTVGVSFGIIIPILLLGLAFGCVAGA